MRGTPDILPRGIKGRNIVEDAKSCEDLDTYRAKKEIEPLYYGQGQAYLYLTDREIFRLHYCIVPTPDEILAQQIKRLWFKFGQDESNVMYEEMSQALIDNNNCIKDIPEEDRIKTFVVERDDEYLRNLKERAELGRDYYLNYELNPTKHIFPKKKTA